MLFNNEIEFSGNRNQPDTFSVSRFNHIVRDYDETIEATKFLSKYIEQPILAKKLTPLERNTCEDLISGLAFIRSQHSNKYNALSSFLTLKLFGFLEDYENQYTLLVKQLSDFKYNIGLYTVLAFDKLFGEFQSIKKHCKKTPGLRSVEQFINDTMSRIGTPYKECINGHIVLTDAMLINIYLRDNNNFINILPLYRTILLFQQEQQKISDEKLRAKRFGATKYAKKESDKTLNASVDANIGLYQENQELRSKIAQLESENTALTTQLAQAKKNVFLRALDKIKGKLR